MSTSTFLFPDLNVWLALAHRVHPHHAAAMAWALAVDKTESFYMCRITQLGLLRLLTTYGVMGEGTLTQAEAWKALDRLTAYWDILWMEEPSGIEALFRRATMRDEISPKYWADGYLAAFALRHGLNLATFDKALAGRVKGSVLLVGM